MAVLDLRGTHGSGKSWIMHQLLARFYSEPIEEDGEHLGYCLPGISTAIIGKYETVAGGCDGIKKPQEVVRRIKLFDQHHDYVLLEGILVAHTFKRYSLLAQELKDYRFLFLNTPLKTCIARVRARRRAKGNKKPFDPKNVISDYNQIWVRTRRKCVEAGHYVKVINWKDPLPSVMEELGCPIKERS